MLQLDSGRIVDPRSVSPAEVAAACASRDGIVIQFSRPEAYSTKILQHVNEACRLAGNRLQVRFYGHYGTHFDAVVLRQLPDVRDLAVDCLRHIDNEEEIGRLPLLERLVFGVFEMDRPDFLRSLNLGQLTRLVLVENRQRNIDLKPLGQCRSLEDLFVNGHAKGIAEVANLPLLRRLTLSAYAKANSLHFIGAIENLAQLTLILGGRSQIDDLTSESLAMLQILRVRGLATLGDLSRLPALAALRVEDQAQLAAVDFSGADLERIWLFNCKTLSALHGLEGQCRLREFFASRVALDLDWLRDRDWPPSATSVRLFSGSKKWNDAAEAQLANRGLGQKNSFWP